MENNVILSKKRKKPIFGMILAVLVLLFGIFTFFAMSTFIGSFLFPESQLSIAIANKLNIDGMHNTFWAMGLPPTAICLVYIFVALYTIVSSVGILKLRNWGRIMLMILAVEDLAEQLINFIYLKPTIWSLLPPIIFDLLILVYFTRRKVKGFFVGSF